MRTTTQEHEREEEEDDEKNVFFSLRIPAINVLIREPPHVRHSRYRLLFSISHSVCAHVVSIELSTEKSSNRRRWQRQQQKHSMCAN